MGKLSLASLQLLAGVQHSPQVERAFHTKVDLFGAQTEADEANPNLGFGNMQFRDPLSKLACHSRIQQASQ